MDQRKKKLFFWLLLSLAVLYAAGIFSPPRIHYVCIIELKAHSDSAKNVSAVVPFPYYDPLPWFAHFKMLHTARPIGIIADTLKAAGATKNIQLALQEDSKRGWVLQVFIPELNHASPALLSDKVVLDFPESFPLPYFFTPAYFLKQPAEIFYLNPFHINIYWDEKDKGFVVNRKHYTYAKVFSEAKNVSVNVLFTARKRYFFGTFLVEQKMDLPEGKITGTSSWQKIPLSLNEKKSLM